MIARIPLMAVLALTTMLMGACAFLSEDDDEENRGQSEPTETVVPTPTPTPEPTPRDTLDQTKQRWSETQGARFQLSIEGETYLDNDEAIQLLGAEGELSRPDRVRADADVRTVVVNLTVSLIFIDDEAYMTDFISGEWTNAPGDFSYNPSLLLNPETGLSAAIDDIQNPEFNQSDNDLSGTTRIDGVVPQASIEDLTAGALEGDMVDISIWTNSDSYDLERIRIAEQGDDDDEEELTVWTIDISDHGEEFTIEAPDV